eukprot:1105589-Amphidinium_carterae.3
MVGGAVALTVWGVWGGEVVRLVGVASIWRHGRFLKLPRHRPSRIDGFIAQECHVGKRSNWEHEQASDASSHAIAIPR